MAVYVYSAHHNFSSCSFFHFSHSCGYFTFIYTIKSRFILRNQCGIDLITAILARGLRSLVKIADLSRALRST